MKTLPPQWVATKLADHLREPIRNGYSPRCPENPTGTWILSLAAVTHSGFDKTGIKPAPLGDEKVAKNLLSAGDIVVSRSNTPDRVGLAGIYEGNPTPCSYPDLLMRVRLTENLDPKFLLAHLLSDVGRRFFTENARGSSGSMVKIDRSILESFPILTPPIEEQRAIASALSGMDALLAKLDQLIAKKRDIKQAAMQELLTGRRRLPGFSDEWPQKQLSEICAMKSGDGITSERIDNHSKYPCYGGNGLRGYTKSRTHHGDYVLIGRQGALCGNITRASGEFFASEHAIVVTPNQETNVDWLAEKLVQMNLNRLSESSAQPGLSVAKILSLSITVPPHQEQTDIAAALVGMASEITALEARQEKTRLIKQGMMQELLSGRVRLI